MRSGVPECALARGVCPLCRLHVSRNADKLNDIELYQAEVANILDVAESSVYEWQSKFRKGGKGGLGALSTKTASGRKIALAGKQLLQLHRWLRGSPRQVQLDFGLWTRKMVHDLIRREFGIDYTLQNVARS